MPWRECKPMDERLRFIARLLEGEKMAVACRQFGISRVTGYKIYNRYKECGLTNLSMKSRPWNSRPAGSKTIVRTKRLRLRWNGQTLPLPMKHCP